MHLAIDPEMNIHAIEITGTDVSDSEGMDRILPTDLPIDRVIADGVYYSIKRGEALGDRGIVAVIPPPSHAVAHGDENTKVRGQSACVERQDPRPDSLTRLNSAQRGVEAHQYGHHDWRLENARHRIDIDPCYHRPGLWNIGVDQVPIIAQVANAPEQRRITEPGRAGVGGGRRQRVARQ
ncbi:transposase [Caballeronia sp. SBC2]|uniref:transposase n=1 Tax=Caballeronia sp. SBC2 TaxID=2705547 RepID=UPI00351A5AF2